MPICINPNTTRLNRKQAAEYLGVTEGTLAVWASTGRYQLPFIKVGRKVFYRQSDLDAFIESNVVTQTR
ncbi:helix-turn-helix domain-containing protein [Vibrio sp. ZSDZ34]|uniref:Helix-turn-helix domain-containing protein n=1 Tax=Vibrio gelatinilyticus TaxID=2893468 RepID=A0A9X1WA80_9VIBR|nr:helix-turn-helix domain-containing protein [Vibrio gelatinilyticus]MCJ2375665.1 helix-turn-helix domain-containing protein [Vibrio gelatinilyticus]